VMMAARLLMVVLLGTPDAVTGHIERVAIIGGGLAGLGTAVSLLDGGVRELHIFDTEPGPGLGGASAVAAGLLHPFRPNGREIWCGQEGFDATANLIQRCERLMGERVSVDGGLLRLAMDPGQADVLRKACAAAESVGPLEQRWCTRGEALDFKAGGAALGAAFAPAALSVDTPAYLRALWGVCEAIATDDVSKEARWRPGQLGALAELHAATAAAGEAPFDAVVVASGFCATELAELRGLGQNKALRPCRGQNLLLDNSAGLATPLICGKYLVPVDGGRRILAGATFEYDTPERVHRPADAADAAAVLRPSLAAMHPPLAHAEILGASAGVRSLPPRSHFGYVPLAGRLPAHLSGGLGGTPCSTWFFGGLGSRGLIHHALLGKAVAEAVLAEDEERIPEHVRRLDLAAMVGDAADG